MATVLSARGIGAPARALAPGDLADFVLVDTPTVEQAVCDVPAVRRVYRKGRPVQAPPPDA
jgi:cytosine/adenosine deaminase-related metal-dependent hydrolase